MLIKYNLLNIINIIRMPWTRRKYFNVVWMMIIFFLDSSKLYKYSVRNCLPSEDMKDDYFSNIFELYKPRIESNFNIDKVNRKLYTRGYLGEIDYDESILINCMVTDENKKATFVTGCGNYLKYYLEEKVDVIYIHTVFINCAGFARDLNLSLGRQKGLKQLTLYMETNSAVKHVPMGSAIEGILAFLIASKSIEVYGWNHYHTKKMSSMNLVEFVLNTFFYSRDYITRDCVEYSLTHLFYAYYFSKIDNLTIHGNLDYFKNKNLDKMFTKKIQKIFLTHCD